MLVFTPRTTNSYRARCIFCTAAWKLGACTITCHHAEHSHQRPGYQLLREGRAGCSVTQLQQSPSCWYLQGEAVAVTCISAVGSRRQV